MVHTSIRQCAAESVAEPVFSFVEVDGVVILFGVEPVRVLVSLSKKLEIQVADLVVVWDVNLHQLLEKEDGRA